MGPRGLSSYLKRINPDGITKRQLSCYMGQTIIIDTSIFMYRFNTGNELYENFFTFLTILKKYNINPIFVFDGKPPVEKHDELNERKTKRILSNAQYNNMVENNTLHEQTKLTVVKMMRQKTRITQKHIEQIKAMILFSGYCYIDAPREADEVCAFYVFMKKAYACLSDDMDLLLFGCNRVLRYFSLLNETVIEYDLYTILNSMNIDFDNFRMLSIMGGTDYNKKHCSIEQLFNYYIEHESIPIHLYTEERLNRITHLYTVNSEKHKELENIPIIMQEENRYELIKMLHQYNFIFVND